MMDYAENNSALMTIGIHPTEPDTELRLHSSHGRKGIRRRRHPAQGQDLHRETRQGSRRSVLQDGRVLLELGNIRVESFRDQGRDGKVHSRCHPPCSQAWEDALGSDKEQTFLEKVYTDCPKVSIDYGVMEKTDRAWLYCWNFGWSDIDSWESLYSNIGQQDRGRQHRVHGQVPGRRQR